MSLQPNTVYLVPEQTALVARAAFPRSSLCMRLYDHLGTIFQDQDFLSLFPERGQPGQSPFRLALITVLQFIENLPDRAAADAVRGRIDWKYLLCLELDDPGFDHSVLCEFRTRLLESGAERILFDTALLAYSVAYGCTAPNFVIREPFQTRLTPFRDARVRRPSYHQFDVNLSKRFRITERTSFQFRLEAYNVTNTPMYDERVYNRITTDSLFGSINKNTERQSNFPRFYQIGMKFLF